MCLRKVRSRSESLQFTSAVMIFVLAGLLMRPGRRKTEAKTETRECKTKTRPRPQNYYETETKNYETETETSMINSVHVKLKQIGMLYYLISIT